MSLWEYLERWWRRPSAADRVLAALFIGENLGMTRMQGLIIRDLARLSGSVYTVLHRLEDAGLVQSQVDPLLTVHSEGGPLLRRRYWLTDEGRARAEQVPPW